MSAEEFTTIILFTAKAGKEDKVRELATSLTESTRTKDKGCINYVFHQRVDSPHEFVLYERWHDTAALQAHVARLNDVYGTPPAGELFPPSIRELFKKIELISLRVIV